VKFQRPGVTDLITSTFTRQVIHYPRRAVLRSSSATGSATVPVQRFNETATDEVQDAVARLAKEGVKGVILDMRGNPGGILDQSIAMSNLFLKDGQEIVSVPRSARRSRSASPRRATPYSPRCRSPSSPMTARPRRARSSRRAAGPRPCARRRWHQLRQGARPDALPARRRVRAEDHHRQVVHPSGRSIQR
jgi:hypothetical protein